MAMMTRRHTPTPSLGILSRHKIDDEGEEDVEKLLKPKHKLTRDQFILMVFMCSVNFFQAVCFSLLAPFFPREAREKNLSAIEYSIVFAEYEFVNFIMTIVFGKFINVIGTKFLYYCGLFVLGVTAILFGFVDKSPPGEVFLILCLSVRLFEGIGGAAFLTASYTITAHEFRNSVSTTLGTLEIFNGLGVMLGPTIGGLLYGAGGFGLPFFTLGTLLLIVVLLSYFFLPLPESEQQTNKEGYFQLLKIPSIIISALSVMVGSLSLGFMDPSLEPHLEKINFTPILVGLAFFAQAGSYSILSPLWGYLSDKKMEPKILCIFGCILSSVGFLLLGPASIINLKIDSWLVFTALAISGMGIAGELIPPFGDSVRTAMANDFPDNIETFALVSSFNLSFISFGSFVGPLLGGVMLDVLKFEGACTVLFIIHLTMAFILIVFLMVKNIQKCCPNKLNPSTDEEKDALLLR